MKLISYTNYIISGSECIIVVLQTSTNNYTRFVIIYRPPSNNYISFIDDLNDLLISIKLNNTILLGDFNFHVNLKDTPSLRLLSLTESHLLHQHVNKPTHTSGNTLGLIFSTNSQYLILNNFEIRHIITDHYAVTFLLNIKSDNISHSQIKYRNLKAISISTFSFDLLSSLTHDIKINTLNNILTNILNKHAPQKNKTIRNNRKCWFNQETILAKQNMRRCQRQYSKHPNIQLLNQFIVSKKVFKKSIVAAKIQHYETEINNCNGDIRRLYKFTNTLLGKTKQKYLPDIPYDIMCIQFSHFFTDKLNKLHTSLTLNYNNTIPITLPNTTCHQLSLFLPTTNDKIKILLNSSKSSAPHDPIPVSLMKRIINSITIPIVKIINDSLNSGYVPTQLKHAIVNPILKKNKLDINDLNNYRPISQLPTIAKLLEKVVYFQLNNYLHTYQLIDKYQSAYRLHHSTETSVLHVIDNVIKSLDIHSNIQLLLLDLSAAFDTLDHIILKQRLIDIGLTDKALDWMMSFISNRTFSIKTGNHYSQPNNLKTGVPQGSVLGPILFLIYIRPISSIIRQYKHIKYHLYADDILLYSTISQHSLSHRNELSNCANDIHVWLTNNKLSLNTNKSELINIPSSYNDFPIISINSIIINPSSKMKYLGITIDRDMSLNYHIQSICSKANHNLYNIRHIRKYINNNLTYILINSLVFSSIDYCNSILIGLPQSTILPINRIIRSAVRTIYRQPRGDHSSVTLKMKSLRILSASERAEKRVLCIAHKALTTHQPEYIRSSLQLIQPLRTTRSTEDILRFEVGVPNLTRTTKRAFSYALPRLWNPIPRSIREIVNLSTFKRNLVEYLLNR